MVRFRSAFSLVMIVALVAAMVSCTCGSGMQSPKRTACCHCCCSRHDGQRAPAIPGSACPHCSGGLAAEHYSPPDLAHLAPATWIAIDWDAATARAVLDSSHSMEAAHGLSPPVGLSTLLHLSCSLIA